MVKKPRVLFTGLSDNTSYPFAGMLPLTKNMPRSVATGISDLEANFALTGNKGNMAIGEAVGRIFDVDRRLSCYLDLPRLLALGWDAERICTLIRQQFDIVVLSMTNALRPEFDLAGVADVVAALDTDLVVLGLGMQRPLPPKLDVLPAGSQRFLETIKQKALLFGVRGHETVNWLHSVGVDNARVLGCPSLYLYPDNFLAIKPPTLSAASRAITAGYLHSRAPRSRILCSLFRDQRSHYVMQGELLMLAQNYAGDERLYDDATGKVDAVICRKLFHEFLGVSPPFEGYWYFQNMDAWRVFCAEGDYYLGDRLHGGIVAMQAGTPSIILWNDLRVREIAELCAIPSLDITSIKTERASELAASLLTAASLERFRDTYRQQLARFDDATAQCGLRRAVAASPEPRQRGSAMAIQQRRSPSPVRRFLSKLARGPVRRFLSKLGR